MVAVLTLCFAATQLIAGGKCEGKEKEKEVKVAIADVPAAVAAALQAQAKGGTIDEIEKEDENGAVTYEADITLGAVKWEAKVGADGTLISMKKADDEKEDGKDEGKDEETKTVIALDQAPAAVVATLQQQAAGGTIDKIVQETEKGVVTYKADITKADGKYVAKVGADGTLIKMKPRKDKAKEEKKDAD